MSKSAFAIAQALQQKFGAIDDAFVAVFPPPPVRGLGTAGRLQVANSGQN